MAGSTRPGQFRTDRHPPFWGNTRRFAAPGAPAARRRFRPFAGPRSSRRTIGHVNADSDLKPTSLL
jgi:hypothetical protein